MDRASPHAELPASNLRPDWVWIVGAVLVHTFILFCNAWVSDDAYITLRTVDNFRWMGLGWNPGERVQAYTHPLWMMLLWIARQVLGNAYRAAIYTSVLASCGALVVLGRYWVAGRGAWLMAVFALTCSKTYMDFATSGLENPLTHVLLALFIAATAWNQVLGKSHKPFLFFLAGLLILNRHDAFLFVAPVLALAMWREKSLRMWILCIEALFPLLAWEAFSLFYYGFPFPNTAYAKLNTGLPSSSLAIQGLFYFWNSIQVDPLALVVIFVAMLVGLRSKVSHERALCLGVCLYLIYIIRIGGDFMSGRFFAAPLFVSVAVLSRLPIWNSMRKTMVACVVFFVLSLASIGTPLRCGSKYPSEWKPLIGFARESHMDLRGICDERGVYNYSTGYFSAERQEDFPVHEWFRKGMALREWPEPVYFGDQVGIGYLGYAVGSLRYILDKYALPDALLARLPAVLKDDEIPIYYPGLKTDWRIGHFRREIPKGYLESLKTGANKIEDPDLREYYERLRLVTRGELWDPKRLWEIVRFNLGMNDKWRDRYLEKQKSNPSP